MSFNGKLMSIGMFLFLFCIKILQLILFNPLHSRDIGQIFVFLYISLSDIMHPLVKFQVYLTSKHRVSIVKKKLIITK